MINRTQIPVVYTGLVEDTSAGPLRVAVSERGLAVINFGGSPEEFADYLRQIFRRTAPAIVIVPSSERTAAACHQLQEYLTGERKAFDLPLDWSTMPAFKAQALQATLDIPYGQTATYAEIALRIGRPRAARAVGRAEATNPLPLVIPCHRVVGTDGGLHGYGGPGGVALKAWLLELEKSRSSVSEIADLPRQTAR